MKQNLDRDRDGSSSDAAVVICDAVARSPLDAKGNPLVNGAWYALFDSDEPHYGVLAQYAAETVDQFGPVPAAFWDESDNEIAPDYYECAVKQS